MDRYRYSRSILSVMLATDSIDPSVKTFHFWPIVSIISFKKNIFSIESFLLKTIDLIDVFLCAVNWFSVSIQPMFFRHRCPTMAGEKDCVPNSGTLASNRHNTASRKYNDDISLLISHNTSSSLVGILITCAPRAAPTVKSTCTRQVICQPNLFAWTKLTISNTFLLDREQGEYL